MDAASIEDINRLRASMGMKPLAVPGVGDQSKPKENVPRADEEAGSTFESRQAEAYDNYKKAQDAEVAKRRREEKAAAVKKAREKAQRVAVLEGKGLGDIDDEDEGDVKSWLKSQKKRQKKIEQALQLEEDKAAAEAAAAKAREYTSKDLAGVRVGHDVSNLDGDDQVLTLKDTTVLDEEEGDELENLSLREREKLNERLELKKKKFVSDPNDFDDTRERGVLSQYDEEIYGKKQKQFTLDLQGTTADPLDDIIDGTAEKRKLKKLDVDVMNDAPPSDYIDISEIKVKKPKKKKSKSTRRRPDDDDDILCDADQPAADDLDQSMDIDTGAILSRRKRKTFDEPFVDDEDLQASLARQRSAALKKRKRARPEDMAKQLREEASQTPDPQNQTGHGSGLVIDEITEFVDALKKPDEEGHKPRQPTRREEAVTAMDDDSDGDVEMEGAAVVKQESEEPNGAANELTALGVEEEKTVAQGMGATLSILKDRGLLKESQGANLNAQFRDHEKFLAEKARRLAKIEDDARLERERDRANGRLERMSVREREEYARKQNERREYQASKVLQDMFNEGYKPNFNIKYIDDYGRELDRKEAFKHLSHQFHGKGSGKGKTDKRLKKIEDEKRREAQSMLDASQHVGMSSATAQQTKKRREAGVRLA